MLSRIARRRVLASRELWRTALLILVALLILTTLSARAEGPVATPTTGPVSPVHATAPRAGSDDLRPPALLRASLVSRDAAELSERDELRRVARVERPRLRPPTLQTLSHTAPAPGRIGAPILMYHYIRDNVPASDQIGRNLSVTPTDFEQQVHLLAARGYSTVTLDDVTASIAHGKPLPARSVVLTFDDGYADFFTNARPILLRHNLRATVYVITGKVGLSGYMDWNQIDQLAAEGFTIAAHTVTHLSLPKLSDAALRYELVESRRTLEERLGKPCPHLAYPAGQMDERVRQFTAAAGYLSATTTRYGIAGAKDDLLTLPRLRISGTMTLPRFAAMLGESAP